MKYLLVLGLVSCVMSSRLLGQSSWQSNSNSAVTFVDLIGSGSHTPPSNQNYFNLYLPFPTTSSGASPTSQVINTPCPLSSLQYQTTGYYVDNSKSTPNRSWVPSGTYNSTYSLAAPVQWYVTNHKSYLRGLEYDGALGGTITGNTDSKTPVSTALVESVFVHQRPCYDGGPEFGFYRIMTAPPPNSTPSQRAKEVYFYYSAITNCTGAAFGYNPSNVKEEQTNCQNPQTGQFVSNLLSQESDSGVKIIWPTGADDYLQNSCSGVRYDWKYRAEATSSTQFTITVLDPCSSAVKLTQYVTVRKWFEPYMTQMHEGGMWAYTTMVIQKSLDFHVSTAGVLPTNNEGDVLCVYNSGGVGSCQDKPAVGITSFGSPQGDSQINRIPDVEPQTFSGTSKIFTASLYSASSITAAQILINYDLNGAAACYVTYVPGSTGANVLNLVHNLGPGSGYQSITVGQTSGSISNNQCTLSSNGSSIEQQGRHIIIKMNLSFNQTNFSGAKSIHAAVQDAAGRNSDWQPVASVYVTPSSSSAFTANAITHSETGSWNVIDPATANELCTVSCLPAIAIKATFTHPSGYAAVEVAGVLINHDLNANNACYFSFGYGNVYLRDDNGVPSSPLALSTIAAGGSASLSNSHCKVTFLKAVGGSTPLATAGNYRSPTANPTGGSGNVFYFQANVEPLGTWLYGTGSPYFAGALKIFTSAQDAGSGNTSWQPVGIWIVP